MNGWSVAGGPVQHRCEIGTERTALENFRVRMKKKALKGFIGGSNDRTVPSDKHLRREWRMSVKRVLYPCPCCGDDVAAMYVSPHAQGLHHSSSGCARGQKPCIPCFVNTRRTWEGCPREQQRKASAICTS